MGSQENSANITSNASLEAMACLSEESLLELSTDISISLIQPEFDNQDRIKTNDGWKGQIGNVSSIDTSTEQGMPRTECQENSRCESKEIMLEVDELVHSSDLHCNIVRKNKNSMQRDGKSEVSHNFDEKLVIEVGDACKKCNSSASIYNLDLHSNYDYIRHSKTHEVTKNSNFETDDSYQTPLSIAVSKSQYNTEILFKNCEEFSNLTSDQHNNILHSTTSLQTNETKENIVNKTLSRSADNLSCTREITYGSELDTDRNITEFDAYKYKDSNSCTIPANTSCEPCEPEHKFPRTNKEIITQDLGSIVKNVHGIFSSMSGSLKHAYNISQRVPVQPINKLLLETTVLKQTVNGKVPNVESNDTTVHLTMTPDMSNVNAGLGNADCLNTEFLISDQDKVESLKGVLLWERQKMETLRKEIKQQSDKLADKCNEKKDLLSKIELLMKRLEVSEKEKDNAVMRYAVSESVVIGTREAAEAAKREEKAAKAEVELLSSKLKSAHAEKQRICQIYDDKCHELVTSEREVNKLKEELAECQGRLKWTQNKLRTETEAYREAIGNVEKLNAQVSQFQSERDAAAANNSDAARFKQCESELKETRASLILRQHDLDELDRRLTSTTQELESCRVQLAEATSSLCSLNKKVSELEVNNEHLEQEAAELAPLRARAALADALSQQLDRERERAARAESEAATERARADTCARREANALEHAARLEAQHVGERCVATEHDTTSRALSADNAALRDRISTLEAAATEAKSSLAQETTKRIAECRLLAAKVAELTSELQQAQQQLEWEKGESQVLRKKNATTVKELNRELQKALKRCETLEARAVSEQPDPSTPTGSMSSLCSEENGGATVAPAATDDTQINGHARTDSASDIQPPSSASSGPLPERQALIERIVQLQRACAKRSERIDFLEEHARQLTAELSHKTRLLRELLPAQPTGALSDSSADRHKREMARLGGSVMAAVYGGASDGITLELSLEINKRLQAVLEDTLLKNITLKRNMDTLGEEIARLKGKGDKT